MDQSKTRCVAAKEKLRMFFFRVVFYDLFVRWRREYVVDEFDASHSRHKWNNNDGEKLSSRFSRTFLTARRHHVQHQVQHRRRLMRRSRKTKPLPITPDGVELEFAHKLQYHDCLRITTVWSLSNHVIDVESEAISLISYSIFSSPKMRVPFGFNQQCGHRIVTNK